ncbi:hypothetical protein N7494_008157 [Penicillium frequentans]|uniref:Zn(2)-C6 fungal-type domain-containing protein n=1 Tax=Penicillium frequentans TaxID=3151616 RepID=A0AAD6GDD0_9EURO|nr:hypothetical protein N7494_008157 [Penicillium glabrum]
MFHRFSARPAKARSQTKGSGSACSIHKKHSKNRASDYIASPEHEVLPKAKRQKAAIACDRCRLHRIKCDDQKPCAPCVAIKAKCIVSYDPPHSSQANNSNDSHARPEMVTAPHPSSLSPSPTPATCRYNNASIISNSTGNLNLNNPPAPLPSIATRQPPSSTTPTPPETVSNDIFNLAHVHGFFSAGQSTVFTASASSTRCLFPQLPHPAVPSGERPLLSNPLTKTQRSYYLRLFWDTCHPLLRIISETEFAELDTLSPPTIFDEYSSRNALVDSMLAVGIQHSKITGLASRILGPQLPTSQQSLQAAPSSEASWPGFEYFDRCRECMRSNTDVTLDALRCHTLMVVYLMKGNAFRDAYNLLGITIRKAYIAKLHRFPPGHLSEPEKTAQMQLWWMLFSLDLQCSLQIDMPSAIQKSLVKCPVPTADSLGRFISSSGSREEHMSPYMYAICLVDLAVVVTDIAAGFSTADLDEDDHNSPAALEHHAMKLSSTLQNLEIWHNQLPSELRLGQSRNGGNGACNTEVVDFNRDLSLPTWLRRQKVLLELYYHNSYTLIQRPFIHLQYTPSDVPNSMIPPESRQPQTELHITSALHHAMLVIDTVFTVCSTSDILFGWSEVLQPLWNATLTIVAFVYTHLVSSVIPRALETLTRAQAVIESFSTTWPSLRSAKAVIQSLVTSLQNVTGQDPSAVPNNDPTGWDIFTSFLEEQTSLSALESTFLSDRVYNGVLS